MILAKKLTKKEQNEILGTLFGFHYDEEVLIDDFDNEFYAQIGNSQFDFSTLSGIFSYTAHRAKNQGFTDCQNQFKKLIGIIK